MERQGFEASLTLNNGSDCSAVTKLRAEVEVRDAASEPVAVTDDPAADGLGGAAAFDWWPTAEPVGEYSVRLRAVRGSLRAAKIVEVDVTDIPPDSPGPMFLIH